MMERRSERVRVLIVDDSALMRQLIGEVLGTEPEIEVVGYARDGVEAFKKAARLKPDVVTVDVELPDMTALEVLTVIQAAHDAAVIMIRTFTTEGSDITVTALERGATDFFSRPERHQPSQVCECRDLLVAKILSAAQNRLRTSSRPPIRSQVPTSPASRIQTLATQAHPSLSTLRRDVDLDPGIELPQSGSPLCIVVGISTGGPQALGEFLPRLSAPIPPILVVQHMPAPFTSGFARRLNRVCSVEVKEAANGERVAPNRVLIAPGGRHMAVTGLPTNVWISIRDGAPVNSHRPSVDVLFQAAARVYRGAVVGIIMTGMGRDGVVGCQAILSVGGKTYGQDEASSTVYGMNKAAFIEGGVTSQFSLEQFPLLIQRLSPAS